MTSTNINMTPTNISFTPKKYASAFGLERSPSPGLQAHTGLANPVTLLLYKKKTSGTEVRRTQDVKLRFVGFNRCVGFNFGHGQLLRFIVVIIKSNSFGHLDSVN